MVVDSETYSQTVSEYQHQIRELKAQVQRLTDQQRWIPCTERLPEDGQRVICIYKGVYTERIVTFWEDIAGNPHFGTPSEPDKRGSQPATDWMPLPPSPTTEKDV